jgi:meso-butanediol dehydrogenase/(S,S)-butanediol dehydrogenase/diacetyl reductase
MQEFQGKVAFVMGGTTGIGRAAADLLVSRGARVSIFGTARSADGVDADLDDLPGEMAAFTGDGSVGSDVAAALDETARRFGGIDILICAAAIHPYGTAESTNELTWDRVMAVNVKSAYLVAHHGVCHLRRRGGGAIVNVASNQGSSTVPNLAAYATSKGALLAFTRSLAMDYGAENIRANTVSPGPIDTPLLRVAAEKFGGGASLDDVYADWGQKVPIRRIGQATEMAEVIAFLASDRASYVTGADFVADGGLLAKLGF